MTSESSGNPRLLVFLHVAAKQRAFQTDLQTALPGIVVEAVADSFPGTPSFVDVTVAVLEKAPGTAGVVTLRVKGYAPAASEGIVQVTVPAAPTAGVVHVQPPGLTRERNVVPAGSVSERDTVVAALGPPFETVME